MNREDIISVRENGGLNFGNYRLPSKEKASDFPYSGDVYKVKTFCEMTKLEKNETFAYESVPGTSVSDYEETESGIAFTAEGSGKTQIILAVDESVDYEVTIDKEPAQGVDRSLSGKLVFSADFQENCPKKVVLTRK